MADGAVYNPETDLFLINSVPLLVGRASGTYFTFAYDVPDRYTAESGVDGAGYYRKTKNKKATMTVVVLPNSEDNDILMALLLAQDQSPTGFRWSLYVQQGGSIYTGFGMVAGEPPLEYSDSPLTRTWKVVSTKMIGKIAGQVAAPIGS